MSKEPAGLSMRIDADLIARMVEKSYLLFAPRSQRGLMRDHPELANFTEFSGLSAQELLFVWYMRCRSSPFAEIPDADKIDECIDLSWPDEKVRESRRIEYEHGRYGTKIKQAMDRMAGFELAPRVNAKHLAEKRIADIRSIISKPMEEAIVSDFGGDSKTYHTVVRMLHQEMVEISERLEGSAFGVVEENLVIPKTILRDFHKKRS